MGLLDDLARQAANVAHGIGRRDAQTAMPAPREVYASELLDRNTCGPCAEIDGRTYATLEDGLEDYPGAGGFIGCDGGSRCRGTLVLVHGPEADPTQDNPGDGGPSPAPTDRTPRGPSGTPRPPQIDDDGNLIPTRPERPPVDVDDPPGDVPQGPVDSSAAPVVDDAGATIPPDRVDDPITTGNPADLDRDPELARLNNDELDRIMVDPEETLERKMAAADEYDARQAGTREQVWEEEQYDAATLARFEEEREAWERAGGYAAEHMLDSLAAATRGKGRKIDRARQVWVEELETIAVRAEEATRGVLIRADRAREYAEKYGTTDALFDGPARVAYYYASRELRDFWEETGGRKTFAEFAVELGITDAKTLARARAADRARADAIRLAEESAERRARRKAERARRRRPLTAGERLAREQARNERIRRQIAENEGSAG